MRKRTASPEILNEDDLEEMIKLIRKDISDKIFWSMILLDE